MRCVCLLSLCCFFLSKASEQFLDSTNRDQDGLFVYNMFLFLHANNTRGMINIMCYSSTYTWLSLTEEGMNGRKRDDIVTILLAATTFVLRS
jgi:hypothetical protein